MHKDMRCRVQLADCHWTGSRENASPAPSRPGVAECMYLLISLEHECFVFYLRVQASRSEDGYEDHRYNALECAPSRLAIEQG
jgi:hypothetical protein